MELSGFATCDFVVFSFKSIKLRGGVIFARIKFKFKLFLKDLWYEPETLCLFLFFTRNYLAEKRIQKFFQELTYFFTGGNSKK